MRSRLWSAFLAAALALAGDAAQAATATFTPVAPTNVLAGTNVVFQVTVAVSSLPGFDAADVVIGSNEATDLAFSYSSQWTSAFSTVTTPTFDNGIYAQDVFVGGNHSTSVGTSLLLGTVTVNTAGMANGAFQVRIDNSVDGVSTLAQSGTPEPLNGTGAFTIGPQPVPTLGSWGIMVLSLLVLTAGTLALGKREWSHAGVTPDERHMNV